MSVIDTWTKEQFLQCISDLYKEAFGVRPRGINYSEWSVEELRTEWKRLEKLAIDEFWYNEQSGYDKDGNCVGFVPSKDLEKICANCNCNESIH